MEQKESFQWSEVLSGFTVHRNREETQMAMLAGMSGHVPFESEMLKEWRTPFLFYRFFIGGAAKRFRLYIIIHILLFFLPEVYHPVCSQFPMKCASPRIRFFVSCHRPLLPANLSP